MGGGSCQRLFAQGEERLRHVAFRRKPLVAFCCSFVSTVSRVRCNPRAGELRYRKLRKLPILTWELACPPAPVWCRSQCRWRRPVLELRGRSKRASTAARSTFLSVILEASSGLPNVPSAEICWSPTHQLEIANDDRVVAVSARWLARRGPSASSRPAVSSVVCCRCTSRVDPHGAAASRRRRGSAGLPRGRVEFDVLAGIGRLRCQPLIS